MRSASKGLLLSLIVLVVASVTAGAQDALQPTVDEVALFKNGLGFALRHVEVPGAGEFVIDDLPVPLHGSFWIVPDSKETELLEAIAFSQPRKKTTEALTIVDLVKANVGKQVEVQVSPDEWVKGTIVSVPEEEPKLPISNSGRGNYRGWSQDPFGGFMPPSLDVIRNLQQGGIVLLKTAQGVMATNTNSIRAIRSSEADFATSVTRTGPGAGLRVKIKGAGGTVRIACLEWGLTWAPSYMVDITDQKEASVICKAEVLNDAEDLAGVTLQFVTGYPNLAFSSVISPMALMGDVNDFINQLTNRDSGRRGDVTMQQAVMSNAFYAGESGGMMAPPVATTGQGSFHEDLFFYPQTDVTLEKGQRAYYPVFAKKAPYEHLYRWQIGDSLDSRGRWRNEDTGENQEEVWHVLRIENAGGIPWTTAPAMTVQESRILGQDTLFFTNPKDKTLLKLTRSVDLVATQVEREIDRQVDALRRHGNHCDLITVEGRLRVTSHKPKAAVMLIEKVLTGEVLETSVQPKTETLTANVWLDNPRQKLTWEAELEPGGELEVTYTYKVYVLR